MAYLLAKRSRIAALRAGVAGRVARRDGKPVTECPYNPNGDETQQFLARYWIIGWNRSRPLQS